MTTKSIKTAYACWLVGGLFGLHHAYLGRYKQAFIHSITFGGFFIAYIRDLWRLPDYLKEVNDDDEEYRAAFKKIQTELRAPSFMTHRFFGALSTAMLISYMLNNTLYKDPEVDFDPLIFAMRAFIPFVVAVIIYAVTTEGPYKASFKWPLFGSYLAFVFDSIRSGLITNLSSALLASLFLNWNLEWDNDYRETWKKKSLVKFLLVASIGCSFMFCCYTLCTVNNLKIEKDGRNITLRIAIIESLDNDDFKRVKEAWKLLYDFYEKHGLRKVISYAIYGTDPEAVERAYQVNIIFIMFLFNQFKKRYQYNKFYLNS